MTNGTTYPIRFESYGGSAVISDFGNLQKTADVAFNTVAQGAEKAARDTARYGVQAKKAKDSTNALADQFTNLGQTVSVVDGPLGGVASRLAGVGTLIRRLPVPMLAFAGAAAAATASLRTAIPAGIDFEAQMLSIEGVLKATGRQADFTAKELNRMAETLDSNSLGDAVEIRKAATELVTFRNISSDLTEDILTLGQDYAQVFGVSMVTATEQLARVLDQPAEGFGRLGRNVSGLNEGLREQARELVESGKLLEAQTLILKALDDAVGGAGASAAGGTAGKVDALAQSWRRLKEAVGSSDLVADSSSAVVGAIAESFDTITSLFSNEEALNISEKLDMLEVEIDRLEVLRAKLETRNQERPNSVFDELIGRTDEDIQELTDRAQALRDDREGRLKGISDLGQLLDGEDVVERARAAQAQRLEEARLSEEQTRIQKSGAEAVTNALKEQATLAKEQLDTIRQIAEATERQLIANEAQAEADEKAADALADKQEKSLEFLKTQEQQIRLLQEELASGKDARDLLEDRLKIEDEITNDLQKEGIRNSEIIADLEGEIADQKSRQKEEQREQLRLQREAGRELERQRREQERFNRGLLNDVFNGGVSGLSRGLARGALDSLGTALFGSGGLARNGFGEVITQTTNTEASGFGVKAVNGINGRKSQSPLPLGGAFDLDFGVLGDVFKGTKLPFNIPALNGVLGNIGLGQLIGRIPGFGNTGATVGAIVGSIIPGIGNVVGGLLGGLFGGLFGSKAPPKGGTVVSTDEFGALDTSSGFNYKDKDGSLIQAAQTLGDGVISVIGELANAINVDLASNFNLGSIGVIDGKYTFEETAFNQEKYAFDTSQRFDTAEEAVTAAVLSAVQRGVFIGLSEKSQSILASATAETIDRAFQQVEFIETVPQRIQDRIRAIEDPLGFALEQIDREFEKLRKQYTDLGLDTSDLARLQELERQQAVDGFSGSASGSSVFEDYLFNLTGSTQSPLSAMSRFQTADFEFQTLAETLRAGGTVDARDFTTLANARLSATSDRFGQGREYFEIFNEVTALTELAIEREQAEVERRIEEANRLTEAVDDQTEQVTQELDRANQTLEDILAEFRNGGFSGLGGFGGIPNFSGVIPQ